MAKGAKQWRTRRSWAALLAFCWSIRPAGETRSFGSDHDRRTRGQPHRRLRPFAQTGVARAGRGENTRSRLRIRSRQRRFQRRYHGWRTTSASAAPPPPKKIDVFILELGINDAFRGVPIEQIRSNLQAIIDQVSALFPNAAIVLAGMQLPNYSSDDYVGAFGAIFRCSRRKIAPRSFHISWKALAEIPSSINGIRSIPTPPASGSWRKMSGACSSRSYESRKRGRG